VSHRSNPSHGELTCAFLAFSLSSPPLPPSPSLPRPAHADDYFLKVDGIAADEVLATNMTGYIRINEFTWGGEAERAISGTTGAGIGKASLNALTVRQVRRRDLARVPRALRPRARR